MFRFLRLILCATMAFGLPFASYVQAQELDYRIPKNPSDSKFVSHGQFKSEPFAIGDVSRFMFDKWAGPDIPVWTYVPSGVDPKNAPILFMMHGASRNPARYLLEWVPYAQANGFIVIGPEFAKKDFSGSRRYNSGFVFGKKGDDYYLRDENKWSFSAIEPLFDHVVQALGSAQTQYTIYGHSAGSQFVHRFLYYKPEARVKRYLAANAGWYTLPVADQVYPYGFREPYGLKAAELSQDRVKLALQKDVIILLGNKDIDKSHSSLRRTPEAMLQGAHRFNRGANFLDVGRIQADKLAVKFGWRGKVVEDVAHSNRGIAKVAANYVK